MEQKEIINWLYIIGLALTVIALGLFAFNQAMTWFYKSEFLQQPCELCIKLNPNLTLENKIIIEKNILNISLP